MRLGGSLEQDVEETCKIFKSLNFILRVPGSQ